MRKVYVGATEAQLAELDLLFPHQGAARVAGDADAPSRHRSHDTRQIVSGYPQIVGRYPQIVGEPLRHERRQIVASYPQIVGAPTRHERRQIVGYQNRHERRQIVGAHIEEVASSEEFKELGLPLTGASGVSIAAGATSDFELKPNRLFLPGMLSLDDDVAKNLIMTSLLIGGQNCLLSTGAIPCRAFAHTTVHKPFKGWTASNAQPITFTLKNIHASVAQVVYGVWWGIAEV